jgi:hypothetical protein
MGPTKFDPDRREIAQSDTAESAKTEGAAIVSDDRRWAVEAVPRIFATPRRTPHALPRVSRFTLPIEALRFHRQTLYVHSDHDLKAECDIAAR